MCLLICTVNVYGVEYGINKEKVMPRIEIYIPTKEEVEEIKKTAKEKGVSVSELIRRALKLVGASS